MMHHTLLSSTCTLSGELFLPVGNSLAASYQPMRPIVRPPTLLCVRQLQHTCRLFLPPPFLLLLWREGV